MSRYSVYLSSWFLSETDLNILIKNKIMSYVISPAPLSQPNCVVGTKHPLSQFITGLSLRQGICEGVNDLVNISSLDVYSGDTHMSVADGKLSS